MPQLEEHQQLPLETSFTKFVTFEKVSSDEERIVEGYISSENLDDQNQIVTFDAIKKAIPDYMQWANLREMHQPIAAGKVLVIKAVEGDEHNKRWWIRAFVADDEAWKKVKLGIYKGFSIGGRSLPGGIEISKLQDGTPYQKLTKLKLTEISLVDRPANPDAKITLWKGSNIDMENQETTPNPAQEQEVVAPVSSADQTTLPDNMVVIEKAAGKAPDPQAIVAQIQLLRNQYELDGDTDAAAMLSDAISSVMAAKADNTEDENGGDNDEDDEAVAALTDQSDDQAGAGAAPPSAPKGGNAMQMAAGALDNIAKAGKALSGSNASMLKQCILSMVQVLASSGDADAQQILDILNGSDSSSSDQSGSADDTSASAGDDSAAKASAAEDLKKLDGQLDIAKVFMGEFEKLSDLVKSSLQAVETRVEALEKKPAAGGPVLSSAVEKTIVGAAIGQPDMSDPAQVIKMIDAQIAKASDAFEIRTLETRKAFELVKLTQQQVYSQR